MFNKTDFWKLGTVLERRAETCFGTQVGVRVLKASNDREKKVSEENKLIYSSVPE